MAQKIGGHMNSLIQILVSRSRARKGKDKSKKNATKGAFGSVLLKKNL